MRAVYEGLCFAARDCYAAMGATPEEVRVTGGAARSLALRRILASVLRCTRSHRRTRGGRRSRRGHDGCGPAAPLFGYVRLASRTGSIPCWVKQRAPDAQLAATYDTLFPIYIETRKAMRPVWRSLPTRARWSSPLMPTIAIIGDRFMLSDVFETAIRECCPVGELEIRKQDLPWPDEPMEHGYAEAGLDGLKEYLGEPDEIVAFVGDAEIFVTHLAPLSAGMMDRLPKLKFVAVSRGGPVNIDMKAARERRHHRGQHARPQCQRGGRIHDRRHPGADAQHHARPRCAARRRIGAAISTAPT